MLTLLVHSAAGSFALRITYGYNVEPYKKDHLVELAELVLAQFGEAITPGKFLVDLLPARKFQMLFFGIFLAVLT